MISYIFLFLLQLAFLWPHFAKAFTLFCLPLRLQEDNMGKKKIWKKCPSSLDLLYHSTVCSFYINGSQDLLWIKLTIQCFYVIVPTTFYFSLVSNWPWFLELFLCLLHLFYLSFWNWYTVYKFRYGLLSIVVLEFYLPIVEEKFCLQINPTRNKIFFEVVYEFLYTFILCWIK